MSLPSPAHAEAPRGLRRPHLWAAGAALVFGLALGLLAEPASDTAYYLAWSRSPSLGYLDHPGAVAWPFMGIPAASLRWAWLVAGLLAMAAHAAVVVRLLSMFRVAPAAGWILFLAPLWLAGALVWTPDVLLLLAFHAGLLVVLEGRRPWLLLPLAALAAASKIIGLYLVMLWCVVAWRRSPWRWALGAMVVAAAVTAITGAEALAFQGARAWGEGPSLGRGATGFVGLLGGQAGVAGPGLFLAEIVALVVAWRRRATTNEPLRRRLWWVVAGAALPFGAGSFFLHIEPNWLAAMHLPLFLLALDGRGASPLLSPRVERAAVAAQVVVLALVFVLLSAAPPWLGRADPLRRLRGWSAWAAAFPTADVVLSDRYQWASQLWLYGHGAPATFDAIEPGSAYRPSALQPLKSVPQHVLLVWSEVAPPQRARVLWPASCAFGRVQAPSHWGAPAATYYEARATAPDRCP